MGPAVGRTSRSTRTVTCTSARRTRSSRGRATGHEERHFSIGQKRATVVVACSRHNAVQRRPSAKFRAVSTRKLVTARALAKTEAFKKSSRDRKRVENAVCALEAYLAARPVAIARAMRCPVRVHVGSDCAEPPQACQVGRPATTVRPFVRGVSVASVSKVERKSPAQSSGR